MKWAIASWDEVSSATIERAWMTTHLVRDRLTLEPDLNQEEDAFLDTEIEHLLLFLRIPDLMPVSEFLNDEALAENTVHEEFFDIVQSAGDVPDDEIDENADESETLGASLSLQEKLKAFRDVLHVLKDRSDVDDNAMKGIRHVQDTLRIGGRSDLGGSDPMAELNAATGAELSHEDHSHGLDLDGPTAHDVASAVASDAMASLDPSDEHHMDASSLLESSENAALSVASAALAEATAADTSILDDTHVHDPTSESEFHAVL